MSKCKVLWVDRSGGDIAILVNNKVYYNNLINIKTKEHNDCIAWFMHDIYLDGIESILQKDGLEYTIEGGYINLKAPIESLYDLNKIQKLSETENFKEENYAFFNYGYVNRLLNKQDNRTGVCGLVRTKRVL